MGGVDTCGEVDIVLADGSSSEPDDGLNNGDRRDDIHGADVGSADFAFDLRAERSGTNAAVPPPFCASAMMCRVSVVLPLASGP